MSLHIITHVVPYHRSIMHMHFYCYLTGGTAYLLDRESEWCYSENVRKNFYLCQNSREDILFAQFPHCVPHKTCASNTTTYCRYWKSYWIACLTLEKPSLNCKLSWNLPHKFSPGSCHFGCYKCARAGPTTGSASRRHPAVKKCLGKMHGKGNIMFSCMTRQNRNRTAEFQYPRGKRKVLTLQNIIV